MHCASGLEEGSKLPYKRYSKSPSSPKPSAQLPAKQLTSPLLPLFPPSSAPRPASTSSSAERAADDCPSPISYWDQPDRSVWGFDNTIYCDSTGCSYDEKKNPRVAKYAVTVAEFDDCSYEEYDDTVFLCGQCNMKCLRRVNGSKIKSKMPIERFLAQRDPPSAAKSTPKPDNLPKWGFEPPNDLPGSQPFWDYRNVYSDHIAAMVAATVTAIPHIPLASAISTAMSTVSKAGPPPQLSKVGKQNRSGGSGPSRSSSPAPSKTPPPVIPKPTPPPPVFNYSKLTMAQVVAGGSSFSGRSESSAVNVAKDKKKYTWCALETSKQIVTKPSAKGTRTSELHLRIPRCPATANLYNSSGSRLVNAVIAIVNKNANSDEILAYKANPITTAKWSARSNLLLKCAQPMGEMLKVALERSIRKDIPEGQADEDSDVEVLNRPPTTSLKFMAVPRFNEDGSPTDSSDLYNDIKATPAWADVSFFSDPKFLSKDHGAPSDIVVLTIVDDNQGSVGRRLMRTVVSFSGATRPCLRWVDKQVQPFCGQCMMWGHGGYNCTSNILRCSKCGENHDYKTHERFCETCQKGAGHMQTASPSVSTASATTLRPAKTANSTVGAPTGNGRSTSSSNIIRPRTL